MAFAVAERSGSFVPAYERDAKGWPEAMVELLGVEFHRGIEEEWDRGPRWSREVLAVEDSRDARNASPQGLLIPLLFKIKG